ncbi:MAG: hypothetical protein AAF039_18810, partial [Bacteroidota bacterium]
MAIFLFEFSNSFLKKAAVWLFSSFMICSGVPCEVELRVPEAQRDAHAVVPFVRGHERKRGYHAM